MALEQPRSEDSQEAVTLLHLDLRDPATRRDVIVKYASLALLLKRLMHSFEAAPSFAPGTPSAEVEAVISLEDIAGHLERSTEVLLAYYDAYILGDGTALDWLAKAEFEIGFSEIEELLKNPEAD